MSQKIKLATIEVTLATGEIPLTGKPKIVRSYDEATRIVIGWALDIKGDHDEKIDYKLVFEDGFTFSGHAKINRRDLQSFDRLATENFDVLLSDDPRTEAFRKFVDPKGERREVYRNLAQKYDFGVSVANPRTAPMAKLDETVHQEFFVLADSGGLKQLTHVPSLETVSLRREHLSDEKAWSEYTDALQSLVARHPNAVGVVNPYAHEIIDNILTNPVLGHSFEIGEAIVAPDMWSEPQVRTIVEKIEVKTSHHPYQLDYAFKLNDGSTLEWFAADCGWFVVPEPGSPSQVRQRARKPLDDEPALGISTALNV